MSKQGVTVVLGAQWGDEGKGKLSDILSQEADVCARCQVIDPCHAAHSTALLFFCSLRKRARDLSWIYRGSLSIRGKGRGIFCSFLFQSLI